MAAARSPGHTEIDLAESTAAARAFGAPCGYRTFFADEKTVHADQLAQRLRTLDGADPQYAGQFVDTVLEAAVTSAASDVHFQPSADGLEVLLRVDGVLMPLGRFSAGTSTNVVTRLKVLAELLTYRSDLPQEGRLRAPDASIEMRVSTFPTIYGEKAVVRLFQSGTRFLHLEDLGLPPETLQALTRMLAETAGAILVTGPAGSGKTTTLYACLREIVRSGAGARSIASIEDPVEVAVAGVAQSQVNPAAGFDLAAGLRSILRQDPQVVMVGEMRDRITAELALQASLTGQLVLTSFHASTAASALSRLLDMGIEPYVIRSGVLGILCQRLVRRLCDCSRPISSPQELLGLDAPEGRAPGGCPKCGGTGYRGRTLLIEMMTLGTPGLGPAILERADAGRLHRLAAEQGMVDLAEQARRAVAAGTTSPAEVRRVLGFSVSPSS